MQTQGVKSRKFSPLKVEGVATKSPQTGWLKYDLFLTVSEAGKTKMKAQSWWLVKAYLMYHRCPPFHFVLIWQKGHKNPLRSLL